MPVITYREALNQALAEEMARDPNVLLMGEEVGQFNGAYKVSEGLLAKFGPPQFIFAPNPTDKVDQKENPSGYYYVRPIATIEPTAIRCGLPVNTQFGFSEIDRLARELGKPAYYGATVLIAWEHVVLGDFARNILKTYGGDPSQVPHWPHADYDTIYVFKITRSEGQKLITFTIDHENLDPSPTVPSCRSL